MQYKVHKYLRQEVEMIGLRSQYLKIFAGIALGGVFVLVTGTTLPKLIGVGVAVGGAYLWLSHTQAAAKNLSAAVLPRIIINKPYGQRSNRKRR